MNAKLVLLILVVAILPLSFVGATGLTINSDFWDMDYNGVISIGDFWQHNYSTGLVDCGVIAQNHLNPVFANGYDWNSDGLVQVAEFQAWARWATGDTWNMSLNNPEITSVIYDLNNDYRVSIGDKYRDYRLSTGFIKRADITQTDLNNVLNNGYDANSDGYVQIAEFQAAANGLTDDTWAITLQHTEVRYVTCYIYDQTVSTAVSAGDYYYNRYYYAYGILRETHRGIITQAEIDDAIAKGFDTSSNGYISMTEYDNYKTAQDVHAWYVTRQNPIATVNSDYYSFIYDTDADGTTEVELGDHYLHQRANGEIYEEGTIAQNILTWVLAAHDLNSDGKVQVGELEAAAEDATGNSWYIQMAPATINTTNYWPITTGNYMEYYRADQHPEYRTKIEIEADEYGAQAAYFTKNNIDTYWGMGGDPDGTLGGDHPGSDVELGFVLKWYIQWNNDWMVSNNSRGDYSTYYDDKHDDIRYRGSDGKFFKKIWWEEDPNSSYAPYCLWPRSLNLANTHVAIDAQTYRRIEYDGTRTYLESGWGVNYKWAYVKTDLGYEGRALRVQFNEPSASGWVVVEDWYLVEGYGLVKIEQYNNTDRLETNLRVRIKADKLVLKP